MGNIESGVKFSSKGCPVCRASEPIRYSHCICNDDVQMQPAECMVCHSTWVDTYRFESSTLLVIRG